MLNLMKINEIEVLNWRNQNLFSKNHQARGKWYAYILCNSNMNTVAAWNRAEGLQIGTNPRANSHKKLDSVWGRSANRYTAVRVGRHLAETCRARSSVRYSFRLVKSEARFGMVIYDVSICFSGRSLYNHTDMKRDGLLGNIGTVISGAIHFLFI